MLVPIQDVGTEHQWEAASQLRPSDEPGVPQTSVATADLVDVSGTMALLEAIVAAAADVPEIDGNRVGQVRRALAQCKLKLNPDAIARSVVELERLFNRKSANASCTD
jgi:hypothetical protein